MQDWIILSPSKEMDWSLGDRAPYLDPSAKKIIGKLRNLSQEVLTDWLGLDQDLGQKIKGAIGPAYPGPEIPGDGSL